MNGRPSPHNGDSLAFFLTWTTYGTWLPGDDRGWSHKSRSGSQPPNSLFAEVARSRMKEPEFFLSEGHRRLVEGTIREHCEIRGWHLHAVNARTNHVHVVVTASGYRPQIVRDQFKSWCTRRLKVAVPTRSCFWTEGACCRLIETEKELEDAVLYVVEAQDDKYKDG